MRFAEIVNRLTGISCPIFGISRIPTEADITRVRRILAFLEDRRVLYVPSEMEVPEHCVQSVLDIRQFFPTEISSLDMDSRLSESLRAMRAACRKFLDTIAGSDRNIVMFGGMRNHWASWVFNGALGEMRGVFGIHIAQLATQHGLDVEDTLASILPTNGMSNDIDNGAKS